MVAHGIFQEISKQGSFQASPTIKSMAFSWPVDLRSPVSETMVYYWLGANALLACTTGCVCAVDRTRCHSWGMCVCDTTLPESLFGNFQSMHILLDFSGRETCLPNVFTEWYVSSRIVASLPVLNDQPIFRQCRLFKPIKYI